MEFRFEHAQVVHSVRAERDGESFRVRIGERTYLIDLVRAAGGELVFRLGDQVLTAYVARDGDAFHIALNSQSFRLSLAKPSARRKAAESGAASLSASMHGQVVRVLVSEGEMVKRGQPLVILEAMKMEIRVTAPHDGRVVRLLCSAGDVVQRAQPLLELAEV
ncbi:MAG: biotin/lipoyl-containing protein [Anaerolineae bacterium]|nr:biotin/lipoyl-binding protein [Anaerolineae bacterium]MDW8297976.1 biotin/lipoyl-containing protein [Anaerolineae bacterium]